MSDPIPGTTRYKICERCMRILLETQDCTCESAPKTTPSWWEGELSVTRGQIVISAITFAVLEFIAALWRHL